MDVQYQKMHDVNSIAGVWPPCCRSTYSKPELAIWSYDTGHIVIHRGAVVRTDGPTVVDVTAKTEISRVDGLPYFLNYGAPLYVARMSLRYLPALMGIRNIVMLYPDKDSLFHCVNIPDTVTFKHSFWISTTLKGTRTVA